MKRIFGINIMAHTAACLLAAALLATAFMSCGGGFNDDSANAGEFSESIFDSDSDSSNSSTMETFR